MHTTLISSQSFGWNYKTHIEITEMALQNDNSLDKVEKRMLGRFSQMPDFCKEELGDLNSSHFFFPYGKKKSFTLKKDSENNAFDKFKYHVNNALKESNREKFLREIGYAVHYLQDVSTPLHTEQGGILQKFFKFPIHVKFEKGEFIGASSRLQILKKQYSPEKLKFSNLQVLFYNTALFSSRPENKVKYTNKNEWFGIQQRCFNRGVDASREFFKFILRYLPAKNGLKL